MKAVYRAIRKNVQKLRRVKGLSPQERARHKASQRLNEIIRLAHEGIEKPQVM